MILTKYVLSNFGKVLVLRKPIHRQLSKVSADYPLVYKNIDSWISLQIYDFRPLEVGPRNIHCKINVYIFTQFDITKNIYLLNNFCIFSIKLRIIFFLPNVFLEDL